MNNKEFIAELSRSVGMKNDQTQKLLLTVLNAMSDSFLEGDSVQVPNFGTFEVKERSERIMVNPSTGQRMLVPPKMVLSFKPVASVKQKLKNGGIVDE